MKLQIVKRALTGVLATSMVASVLAFTGCSGTTTPSKPDGGNNATGEADPDNEQDPSVDKGETVRLNVYSSRANYEGLQGGWTGQMLKDKFNVELNIIQENGSTITTLMQQGDIGDFQVWGACDENYTDCAKQGLFLDWEEDDLVQEYGPYLWENCQADLQHVRDFTEEGKIFGVCGNVSPSAEAIDDFFYSWDIRWDLYEQLGCPEIKDFDDLYDLFVAMHDLYPETGEGLSTYAMSLWPDWDGTMVMYVKCLAQAYYGLEGDWVLGLYDVEDGTYYDCLQPDGPYLKALAFMNKLYRAGLLDPDSMTQKYDDVIAKVKNDRVFFSIFNYSGSLAYNTTDNIAADKAMYSMVPTDARTIVYGLSTTGSNSMMFTIGENTAYPELCMQIINWLFSPEGRVSTDYGPKDLCWYIGDDGKTHFTPLGLQLYNDPATTFDDVKDENGEVIFELPEEFEAYRGLDFKSGTAEMNIVTWNAISVNPETNERYNAKYWASTQEVPAAGSIEAQWREWASAQSGGTVNVTSEQDYLATTNYSVAVAHAYDKVSEKTSDMKTLWSQVTEALTSGTWKAMYAKTEEEFDQLVAEMTENCKAYGNGTGYDELVEWSQKECDLRHASEEEARAAAAK